MIPRVVAPAPAIEAFIDYGQEYGDLDACTGMTLRLYGDDDAMMPIANRRFPSYRERRQACIDLATMADTIMTKLPERRRAGLVCAGMKHIVHATWELAETLSGWAIEDEIEGGCMLDFRQRPRCRNGITFRRTDRRVRSPKFIRRYVKNNGIEHADHLMQLTALMIHRAQETKPAHDPAIMSAWRAQINHSIRIAKAKDAKRFGNDRKMILRSLRTAINIVGVDTVRAFLRGEQIKLIGNETVLLLRKRGQLADRGHGALSVAVADRNGTQLADLCTYIEDTPMLDQLSGFALWMQSGEEQRVIGTANIIELAPAGQEHPMLKRTLEDRLTRTLAELTEMLGHADAERVTAMIKGEKNGSKRQLSHEEMRARNFAYWEETKGEWMEAVVAFVIGYRNLPIFKAAGAL